MFKKILAASAIYLGCSSTVFAASFYLAPSLVYIKSTTSAGANFYGLTPAIAAGYGDWLFCPFYIAAEFFVQPLKPITFSTAIVGDAPNPRPAWSYGASVFPGINFDGFVKFYARLGLVYSRFDVIGSTLWGAQVGPGLEWVVTDNWSVRGEYILSYYNSGSGSTPQVQEGLLGVVYHFI